MADLRNTSNCMLTGLYTETELDIIDNSILSIFLFQNAPHNTCQCPPQRSSGLLSYIDRIRNWTC